ncbi:MAG: hypothetical protein CM1200mP18_17720 [Gammaproteobacteria bacterium]|nr:MAG: hypothetical protein CM1200mP18_17720 [Gammaproteobacteria bacterium]
MPVERLTSQSYASVHASAISQGKKAHVERLQLQESPGTTHLCTVDYSGNIVSMTHSLGMMSGVITPEWGLCITVVWVYLIRDPAGRVLCTGQVEVQFNLPDNSF